MTAASHIPGPYRVEGRTVYALNEQGFNIFSAQVQDAHTPAADLVATARLLGAAPLLLIAARSALAYDDAIRSCANDPAAMSSLFTAQGDTLDTLYEAWISASRTALAAATGAAQ